MLVPGYACEMPSPTTALRLVGRRWWATATGAFLSLWTAARYPDAVRAVVAVDGLPYLPTVFDLDATPDTMRDRAEAERSSMLYACLLSARD